MVAKWISQFFVFMSDLSIVINRYDNSVYPVWKHQLKDLTIVTKCDHDLVVCVRRQLCLTGQWVLDSTRLLWLMCFKMFYQLASWACLLNSATPFRGNLMPSTYSGTIPTWPWPRKHSKHATPSFPDIYQFWSVEATVNAKVSTGAPAKLFTSRNIS